jgi:hypothetical protein
MSEADWKTFKKVHPLALRRYFDRALGQIEETLRSATESLSYGLLLAASGGNSQNVPAM